MKIGTTRSASSLLTSSNGAAGGGSYTSTRTSSSSSLLSISGSPSPGSPSLSRRFRTEVEPTEDAFPRTCSHLPAKVSGYQYFLIIPHWDTVQLLESMLNEKDPSSDGNNATNGHFHFEQQQNGDGHPSSSSSSSEAAEPIRPKLLMFRNSLNGSQIGGNAGWHLPVIFFEKQPYFRVPAIIKAAQDRWGLKLKLTLNLEESYDPHTDFVQLVYLVDVDWNASTPSDIQLPAHSEWADSSILSESTQYSNLKWIPEQWFNEMENQTSPPHRAPWAFPGWYLQTKAWILSELEERMKVEVKGELEQIDLSCLSLILRINTNQGHIYFKASAPEALPHEGALTAFLSDTFPGQVTGVLGFNREYGLLMEEFKGKHLGSFEDYDTWARAISAYAKLQIACVDKTEAILELDCPDRRVPHLLKSLEEMVQKPAVLKVSNLALNESELRELRASVPKIQEIGERLMALGLPDTLDHGDLYPSNIIIQDHSCLVFDWAEASITHPFFSLLPFFRDLPDALLLRKNELLKVYLEHWMKFQPMETLLEAWRQAEILGMLLQAVKFWEIVHKIEPNCRHYDQPSVPLWTRFLLNKLKNPRKDIFRQ